MRRLGFVFLVSTILTIIHAFFFSSTRGQNYEMSFLDFWFNLRGEVTPPEDIVLIGMDEESYRNLELSSTKAWPRRLHAELLRKLKDAGAKKAVFDVLFIDPGLDPEVDKELSDAMASIPTVIGAEIGTTSNQGNPTHSLISPFEAFSKSAESVGLVGFQEDSGYVRRFYTPIAKDFQNYNTLSEGAATFDIKMKTRPTRRDFINFYGPAGKIPYYSYYQLLEKEVPFPNEKLRDKIVFIGIFTRTGIGSEEKDSFVTPYTRNQRTFGVEIHATAALNLIYNNWVRRSSEELELSFLSLVSIGFTILILGMRPISAGVFALLSVLGWCGLGYTAFLGQIFIPGAIFFTIIVPVSFLTNSLYYYIVIRLSQLRIKKAFEFYISPEMAKEIALNPEALRLGGDNVVATALFTDIERFTEITESMSAQEATQMLNDYFSEVMEVIFVNKGTLIKFIGDAVFALWGAPARIPNHAKLACQTALAISEEVARFNNSSRYPRLNTRLGIHTGNMVVGNLGSRRRFDFTAIGDSVNLASRIEGLNKYFGTTILITEYTAKEIGEGWNIIPMGSIRVVGKTQAIKIYSLWSNPFQPNIISLWHAALNAFESRNWNESESMFLEIISSESLLKYSAQFFSNKIAAIRKLELPLDWKGEIDFEKK